MNLHFLHGFLGTPKDWTQFENCFPNCNLYFHSLESFLDNSTNHTDSSFLSWSKNFNHYIFHDEKFRGKKNIIIGYSLGGRLALHCLDNNFWDGAVIISTNPGLSDPQEKIKRVESDTLWAQRFLYDDWNKVINDWNAQGVFDSNSNAQLIRLEKNYNRQVLSNLLVNFSLGIQENLWSNLDKFKIPILYLTGSLDKKFDSFSTRIQQQYPSIKTVKIQNSGHRVPWENTRAFVNVINDFLKTFA